MQPEERRMQPDSVSEKIPVQPVTLALAKQAFPVPEKNVNKGTFGKAAILAGSASYGGAAVLALGGAAAMLGAGYVHLYSLKSVVSAGVTAYPNLLYTALPEKDGAIDLTRSELPSSLQSQSALAVGMGMTDGEPTYRAVSRLLHSFCGTLILDADALNALARYGKEPLKDASAKVVLTPHPVEFSRLTGLSVRQILDDPVPAIHSFCREYGVTVLLKGAETLVADGTETYLSSRGAPGMAKAGSGDVLSGVLAGLFARRNALSEPLSTPLLAAIGAYVAGVAGEIAQRESNPYSALPTDTVSAIKRAVTQIYNAPIL